MEYRNDYEKILGSDSRAPHVSNLGHAASVGGATPKPTTEMPRGEEAMNDLSEAVLYVDGRDVGEIDDDEYEELIRNGGYDSDEYEELMYSGAGGFDGAEYESKNETKSDGAMMMKEAIECGESKKE